MSDEILCQLCDGSGFVVKDGAAADCPCTAERRLHQAIARAGIPDRYRVKTFDAYDASQNQSAGLALMMCRRFVEEWPTNPHRGMLLTGPVGIGKTHLTAVTLIECVRKWRARVAFVDLPELFTRIKATFDPNCATTEYEILRPILASDILAIDEVGAARSTDWAFAMTEHIINTRYNADKATIVTTNFENRPVGWTPERGARPRAAAVDDYQARMNTPVALTTRRETLGDRVGERMWSRLQEMCVAIEMQGADQRAEAKRRRG